MAPPVSIPFVPAPSLFDSMQTQAAPWEPGAAMPGATQSHGAGSFWATFDAAPISHGNAAGTPPTSTGTASTSLQDVFGGDAFDVQPAVTDFPPSATPNETGGMLFPSALQSDGPASSMPVGQAGTDVSLLSDFEDLFVNQAPTHQAAAPAAAAVVGGGGSFWDTQFAPS
eukprot:CAMPEP_0115878270 /NCGR_PEP_ID=MMETSP0287-20121206/26684_1 /TAXON_ID=412157 /ORGANISM="Chrysochromulina rotalis, Strain UIO044" /LENGTH=169 /DNA_ID=CAMNT_0003333875 /DNA_START=42 /DNA_END=551 /DNA_ORIENTATION=+